MRISCKNIYSISFQNRGIIHFCSFCGVEQYHCRILTENGLQ